MIKRGLDTMLTVDLSRHCLPRRLVARIGHVAVRSQFVTAHELPQFLDELPGGFQIGIADAEVEYLTFAIKRLKCEPLLEHPSNPRRRTDDLLNAGGDRHRTGSIPQEKSSKPRYVGLPQYLWKITGVDTGASSCMSRRPRCGRRVQVKPRRNEWLLDSSPQRRQRAGQTFGEWQLGRTR